MPTSLLQHIDHMDSDFGSISSEILDHLSREKLSQKNMHDSYDEWYGRATTSLQKCIELRKSVGLLDAACRAETLLRTIETSTHAAV